MARTAPSGVIATSAAWPALSLSPCSASPAATARSAMRLGVEIEAGLHDDRLVGLADIAVQTRDTTQSAK